MTSRYVVPEMRVSKAKLRGIARWLGWRSMTRCNFECSTVCTGWIGEPPGGSRTRVHIPDFCEDEYANAAILDMLLETFPYVTLCFQRHKGVEIETSGLGPAFNFDILVGIPDRKRAIVEIALKLASELPKE